ncbi:MetQ/NlpA family ABC transporter substrate-binding protein [Cellulomonas sp. ATA003]|uniref:MetQ/NlpA family ABC transporter substrate-binding protein n=1 Tax=Cellulomonas sp. ATA003 TaxID=3073064 RepID=UPI002873A022|nr:MetQ/NlpA family ABC transporter substrate-binding protein [Cellulomonas sp. ATA003]WNB85473.1 MetQ/NlpA family ABC transporter substrate-binding protein [Cellulomonas sp. ATA003]
MKRTIAGLLTTATVAASLAACGGADGADGAAAGGAEPEGPIQIGVADQAQDYWRTFEELAAEAGIEVELVNFTDYTQPNPILSQGDLDLNQFQHLLYLANYNVAADDDLVPVGSTALYQLGLYTTEGYESPDDIPDGAEIAIPNDVVNQARALLVLQSAGLIELEGGGNAFSTPAQIDEEASRVTVVPVDANQTAVQVNTLDAAVINNNFATDAGIDPTTAIYSDLQDTEAARPYLNVWVARAEDADDPTYLELVEIYQSPEVLEALEEQNGGTAITEVVPPEELQAELAELEELVRTSDAG